VLLCPFRTVSLLNPAVTAPTGEDLDRDASHARIDAGAIVTAR
jgi:hypothetical protein